MVTDPELIKQITVKEFNSFTDHVTVSGYSVCVLQQQLTCTDELQHVY